ncbi:unnamed protein product [Urochloa humidicola]
MPVAGLLMMHDLVQLLVERVLPDLRKRPLVNLLWALHGYGDTIRELGAGVGGGFLHEANLYADRIQNFVVETFALPHFDDNTKVRDAIDALIDQARRFIDSYYTLSQEIENEEAEVEEEQGALDAEEEQGPLDAEEEQGPLDAEEAAVVDEEAAQGPVHIRSLREALLRVVVQPGEGRCLVAEKLSAREAGPLFALIVAQEGHQDGPVWFIGN